MATPNTPLWEVFIRSRNGLAHKHVGSLHAFDATLALQAARDKRPHLALIEPELSGCGGWWLIKQIQAEHLAAVVEHWMTPHAERD